MSVSSTGLLISDAMYTKHHSQVHNISALYLGGPPYQILTWRLTILRFSGLPQTIWVCSRTTWATSRCFEILCKLLFTNHYI